MLFDYLSLAGGLVVLIIAGDILVRGSVGIAQRLGIPSLVIGLTIVAFGTSAPELVISLKAAMQGSGGIAIGNVVGSNIANVLLVMGLPALIAATPCGEDGATRNAVFMVAVSCIFAGLCFFSPLGLAASAILLTLLVGFLGASAVSAQRHRKAAKASAHSSASIDETVSDESLEDVEGVPESVLIAIIYILLGMIGLPLGAHFTIGGATSIAAIWGVSDAVIALTVIALGTSLPELATTVMAAIRQHGAVAIGNVIGSNIFNLLAITGITTAIVPIDVPAQILKFDIWVMLACALILLCLSACRICLGKISGFALVTAYCLYIFTVYAFSHAI